MIVYRIAGSGATYGAGDLTGAGAAVNPGRWNKEGENMLYTAINNSLAVLETAAHIDSGDLPLTKTLLEIEIPDQLWDKREVPTTLPPGWQSVPSAKPSFEFGSNWYQSQRSPILVVPSAIIEEDLAVLINSNHPDVAAPGNQLRIIKHRPFYYQNLFRKQKQS